MDLLELVRMFEFEGMPTICRGEDDLMERAVGEAAAAIRPRIHAFALALLRSVAEKGGADQAGAVVEGMDERSLLMATCIGALLFVYGARFTLHALGLGATDIPVGPAPQGGDRQC
jgi:hypothetical protein